MAMVVYWRASCFKMFLFRSCPRPNFLTYKLWYFSQLDQWTTYKYYLVSCLNRSHPRLCTITIPFGKYCFFKSQKRSAEAPQSLTKFGSRIFLKPCGCGCGISQKTPPNKNQWTWSGSPSHWWSFTDLMRSGDVNITKTTSDWIWILKLEKHERKSLIRVDSFQFFVGKPDAGVLVELVSCNDST